MKRVAAIAKLTFAEGFRLRIVLACLLLLAVLIVRMPFTLEGDDTVTGRLQNYLAYSLSALTLLLSLATIFFSCATLTTEFKERSLHLVLTKPVSRFEVLLGKWLGVNLLNLLIVALGGAAIYGLAYYLQTRPEQFRRDRLQVRDVVWTARAAGLPLLPAEEIDSEAREKVENAVRTGEIQPQQKVVKFQELVIAGVAAWRTIPPGYVQEYRFRNLRPPEREDTVIQVRYKARATPLSPDERAHVGWQFCDPQTGAPLHPVVHTSEKSGYMHQFLVQAAPVVRDGEALLHVYNLNHLVHPQFQIGVYFDGEDSLQLMYRVGAFEPNFVKALGVILLKLALLSAVGLFFSAFVSFPVACLCTCAFGLICVALPFILEAIGANDKMMTVDVDPYGRFGKPVRMLLVPFIKTTFPNFAALSGTRDLVDGRYIDWPTLGRCAVRMLVYGGVLLLVPGWFIFNRREIAQVTV